MTYEDLERDQETLHILIDLILESPQATYDRPAEVERDELCRFQREIMQVLLSRGYLDGRKRLG